MEYKLKSLLEYIESKGRVCPMPNYWNKLWQMLPERKQKVNGGWNPSLPLILAAWWDTTAEEKRQRLRLHVQYAADHGVLDQTDNYVRSLSSDQWAYGDGTTNWENWKLQKND